MFWLAEIDPKKGFIKNGFYGGFFALLLYKKRPLSAFIKKGLFRFIALSKTAFIGHFWSLLVFINNSLNQGFFAFSRKAFIKNILLYRFIKMVFICIYLPLLKTAFSDLLLCPLLKMAFIGLYHKRPFSLYRFI